MARAAKRSGAKKAPARKKTASKSKRRIGLAERITLARRFVRRWVLRLIALCAVLACVAVVAYTFVDPGKTPYMRAEGLRIGEEVDHLWVDLDEVAPVMARSVVAAEDANFCAHFGFDMTAIRAAVEAGRARGASTISQQVVKNVYLWQGRSYVRKALEAGLTPMVELVWTKRRIVEVYLNIAEFDDGVFGVEAAARHYFGVGPGELTARQAARLAAILPSPKKRSASRPSNYVSRRASQIADGAATIRRDGRADCFED
jgi:monofunctional biosynthetic peptidoglycan transglycosylase